LKDVGKAKRIVRPEAIAFECQYLQATAMSGATSWT
jgi:hypothetical protein